MSQIIVGSIILSLIHALILSHWLPLITIGTAQGWDNARLLGTTALTGLSHTVSTTLVGFLVSFAGIQFTKTSCSFPNGLHLPSGWQGASGFLYSITNTRPHTHF